MVYFESNVNILNVLIFVHNIFNSMFSTAKLEWTFCCLNVIKHPRLVVILKFEIKERIDVKILTFVIVLI